MFLLNMDPRIIDSFQFQKLSRVCVTSFAWPFSADYSNHSSLYHHWLVYSTQNIKHYNRDVSLKDKT